MKYNFSVIGEGHHSQRYINSLLVYDKVNEISSMNFFDDFCDNTDVIVIPEPFILNSDSLEFFKELNFTNYVFCEKLPFNNLEDIKELINSLSNAKLYFVHTRLFEKKNLDLNCKDFKIRWPNIYATGMDPIWNTIPNILDWIYRQTGEFPSLGNTSLNYCDTDWIFKTTVKDISFNISIYPSEGNEKVSINLNEVEWPNYIFSYQECFDYLLEERESTDENHQYTINEILFVNQLINRKDN